MRIKPYINQWIFILSCGSFILSCLMLLRIGIKSGKYDDAILFVFLFLLCLGLFAVYKARFQWPRNGLLQPTKEDYASMLRQQEGMMFKFIKEKNRFIHTVCDGMLLYRFGLKPEDVVGKTLHDFLPDDVASEKLKCYQKAWEGQEDVVYEGCINGIVYMATLRPMYRNGQVVEVLSSCLDITALKQTLSALHESEERFRQIAEHIEEVFWIADPVTLKFLYLSPAYEKIWGFSRDEFFQDPHKMFKVIHPEDRTRVIRAQQDLANGNFNQEYRIIRADGTVRWIKDRGFPVNVDGKLHRIVGIAEDITDIRDNEELLIKSEKLAVLGELAAGIAHEIRNPLTSLKGFVQLMQKQQQRENTIYMDIMLSEINRINEIVGEFLVLAKPITSNFVSKDISVILQQVMLLMDPDCALRNINMEYTFDYEHSLIKCEENHLKQVFINIIKNALEAMPHGGKVTIELKQLNQELIRVRIKDDGCGIPPERLRYIGEPFYTTKEKGTGLGLMVSYKIIHNHQGQMEINSVVGEGTTVDIQLPLAR